VIDTEDNDDDDNNLVYVKELYLLARPKKYKFL